MDDLKSMHKDLLGRLGIYEVSASQFLPLVKPVLGGCLKETLVVIQLDATDPWTFFDSLEDWLQGLEDLLLDMTREDDDGYKSCKKWGNGDLVVCE